MININAARIRPENRIQTQSDKRVSSQKKTYTPPIGGMVTNTPMAEEGDQTAVILENFWPTTTGIEPRGGTKLFCTIASGVQSLFQYQAGLNKTYFAADKTNIYEFSGSTPEGSALSTVVTAQTSADYSVLEMQTDGGSFLTIVNGQDPAQIYDGTKWHQVTAASSPFAIYNISTNHLSHIWAHRNRTFFIERGTMNAWYLGVNSVEGSATRLPLAGVFNKGGSLFFGATWSSDSGSGMNDRCVFATDQGEFAVYSGADPGDVNDWQLNGVYNIGEPLGKNSTIRVGGDLIVATKAGLIPISAAVEKDASQLKLNALSRSIDPDWRMESILSGNIGGWRLIKWDSRNMAIVSPPNRQAQQGYCWAVNLATGAWSKFTGWTIGDISVLGGSLYYGDDKGNIYLCDIGGYDGTKAFECRACFSFDHLNSPGVLKIAHAINGTWKYNVPFEAKHTIATDYTPLFKAAPSVPISVGNNQGEWDVSFWDKDIWATNIETYKIKEKWESVPAHGKVLAPQIQVTSEQIDKLDCELISIDLVYSVVTELI